MDNPFVVAFGVLLAFHIGFMLLNHPRAALILWLIVTVILPVWLQVQIVSAFTPLSVLSLCLIPAIFSHTTWKLAKGDFVFIAFAGLATISWALFATQQAAWASIFTQTLGAYAVGRVLGPAAGEKWVTKTMAVTGIVVGIWAIVEFAFGVHLYENFLVAADSAGWHSIQTRGPFSRSEGAFGHSIAMGGFLALCIPFVIANKTTGPRKIIALAIVSTGVALTFSRGALIGAAAAIILSLMFLPVEDLTRKLRHGLTAFAIVVGAVAVPVIFSIFDSVSFDLDVSTQYRGNLLTNILSDMRPFGIANGVYFENGRQLYRTFTSIDNAFVQMILTYGWLPVAALLVGLGAVLLRVLRRRGSAADVAIISTAVVLTTVAFITQYGSTIWFVAGLAVGFVVQKQRAVETGGGRRVTTGIVERSLN